MEIKAIVKQPVKSIEGLNIPVGIELVRTEFNGEVKYITNISRYPRGMTGVSLEGMFVEFNPIIFDVIENVRDGDVL